MSGDHEKELGVEPDAWATFTDTYGVMDDLDADREYLIVEEDTHAEPLFAASTIQEAIENLRQKIYAEGFGEDDKKERVAALDALKELEEVFSSE
jgi:hypothetical protein